MEKRLYKSRNNKMISGICGGIGEYFNIDPTIVRLIWVVLSFAWFSGIVAYIICIFVIPDAPYDNPYQGPNNGQSNGGDNGNI